MPAVCAVAAGDAAGDCAGAAVAEGDAAGGDGAGGDPRGDAAGADVGVSCSSASCNMSGLLPLGFVMVRLQPVLSVFLFSTPWNISAIMRIARSIEDTPVVTAGCSTSALSFCTCLSLLLSEMVYSGVMCLASSMTPADGSFSYPIFHCSGRESGRSGNSRTSCSPGTFPLFRTCDFKNFLKRSSNASCSVRFLGNCKPRATPALNTSLIVGSVGRCRPIDTLAQITKRL